MGNDIIMNALQNFNPNNDNMKSAYNADAKTSAGRWYFNSNNFMTAISSYTNITSIISEQSNRAESLGNSVVGQLKSPEGQEMQGSIESCFTNIVSSARNVISGIGYIMTWAVRRYNNGVQAGLISTRISNSLQDSLKNDVITMTKISNNNKNNNLVLTILGMLFNGDNLKSENNKFQKNIVLSNKGTGTGSLDSKNKSMYQEDSYIATIDNCWERLFKNGKNIKYGAAGNVVPYDWSAENWNPQSRGRADCSSFVSWTLYEYGYDEFGGEQHYTWDYTDQNNLERWKKEYGWEYNTYANGGEAAKNVKAGDIVAFNGSNDKSSPAYNDGHMFIVRKVEEDGTIVTYDAGDQSHWTAEETQNIIREEGVRLANYMGSEEGTTSGYFLGDNKHYNMECTVISVDLTLDI